MFERRNFPISPTSPPLLLRGLWAQRFDVDCPNNYRPLYIIVFNCPQRLASPLGTAQGDMPFFQYPHELFTCGAKALKPLSQHGCAINCMARQSFQKTTRIICFLGRCFGLQREYSNITLLFFKIVFGSFNYNIISFVNGHKTTSFAVRGRAAMTALRANYVRQANNLGRYSVWTTKWRLTFQTDQFKNFTTLSASSLPV